MDEFGQQLLGGYEQFGHREHLHMTWSYLRRGEPDRVFPFLRHVAASHGGADTLNVTLTRFWVGLTAHAIEAGEAHDFDQLLQRMPQLLDKSLPFRHWSRERIFASDARVAWVDPDLAPLPF
jgi:hypothetical protein